MSIQLLTVLHAVILLLGSPTSHFHSMSHACANQYGAHHHHIHYDHDDNQDDQ